MRLPTNLQEFAEHDIRNHIRVLVQGCEDLPTIPATIEVILTLVDDINTSLDELETAIMHDLSCTVRVLQMANSVFYGSRLVVTSVRRAILLLGFNTIKNIAMHLPVFGSFLTHNTSEIAAINRLWLHNLAVATLSRRIAVDLCWSRLQADLAFCAGLLHDLGRVVLLHLFPEASHQVLSQIERDPEGDLLTVELRTFHVTHAQVGRWFAEAWHLPAPLLQTIAYHHHSHVDDPLVMTVMLADYIVRTQSIGSTEGHHLLSKPHRFAKTLNLPPRYIEQYGAYIQIEADDLQRIIYSHV
jgi:HD-like signal output (HDOD) protein